jgi:hypothetical protein
MVKFLIVMGLILTVGVWLSEHNFDKKYVLQSKDRDGEWWDEKKFYTIFGATHAYNQMYKVFNSMGEPSDINQYQIIKRTKIKL